MDYQELTDHQESADCQELTAAAEKTEKEDCKGYKGPEDFLEKTGKMAQDK
jgi:hypothetical protein